MAEASTSKAGTTVSKQRRIQKMVARKDAASRKSQDRPMQTGARRYPVPPFPKQHYPKPGHERVLDPQPMYDAPFYRGSQKLQDKVAIITGGDSGIGRAVAVLFAREGADVVVLHLAEKADAAVTKAAVEGEGRQCLVVAGDVAKRAFCEKAVARTLDAFG